MKAKSIFLIIYFFSIFGVLSLSTPISFDTPGDGYSISGNVITISGAGPFELSGEQIDKKLIISSSCTLNLKVFSLTNIGNLTPIIIEENKQVNMVITDFNFFYDSSTNENEGCIYLKKGASLTISGTGTLSISPNKNMAINGTEETSLTVNDGVFINIVSESSNVGGIYLRKEITFNDAMLNYECLKGTNHAIDTEGTIKIVKGSYTINSGGGKGIQAEKYLYLGEQNGDDNDLMLSITTSNEGIEAKGITLYSGIFDINSGEDGINASSSGDECGETVRCSGNCACYINIAGGMLEVIAGEDGLDSNGDITISGGQIQIYSSNSKEGGDQPIDQDGLLNIKGGSIIAAGSPSMGGVNAQTTQIAKTYTGNINKGTKIEIINNGITLLELDAPINIKYIYLNYATNFIVKIGGKEITLSNPTQNQQQPGNNPEEPNANPPSLSSSGSFFGLRTIFLLFGIIIL